MARWVGVAVLLLSSLAGATEKKDFGLHLEYLDLLGPEVVGETGDRRYDVGQGSVHLGTVNLQGGQMLGGGVGLRAVFTNLTGVRLSVESSYFAGRFREGSVALPDLGVIARAELLGSLGIEGTIGEIFTIHTATVTGLDYSEFDARASLFSPRAIATPMPASGSQPATPVGTHLSNTSMRLGQQVGVHIQIAKMIAMYADGTYDYDGQWRVRAGISIGRPVTKKSVEDNESGFRMRPRDPYRRW